MHHPFHVHGAGRFLILARDGEPESNLVWKDTVLITTGETVDILLDVTNVGRWMAHCHIAEHHESGMMFTRRRERRREVVVVGAGQAGLAMATTWPSRAATSSSSRPRTGRRRRGESRWDSLVLFYAGAPRQPARQAVPRRPGPLSDARRGGHISRITLATCRLSSTAG